MLLCEQDFAFRNADHDGAEYKYRKFIPLYNSRIVYRNPTVGWSKKNKKAAFANPRDDMRAKTKNEMKNFDARSSAKLDW